jgi:la-related protein 4
MYEFNSLIKIHVLCKGLGNLSSQFRFDEQDTFLLSKMNKDHFVDLSVIAEFKMIKQLTSDVDLILKSIKGSDKVIFAFH